MELKPPLSFFVTSWLCEKAMRTPLLPFLFPNREDVHFSELLPNWRFFILLHKIKELGFTAEDILSRAPTVENTVFETLGWIPPREIDERLNALKFKIPAAPLTRIVFEKLMKGAAPKLITNVFPLLHTRLDADLHATQSSILMFSCGKIVGVGELLNSSEYPLLLLQLLEEHLIDFVWGASSLNSVFSLARNIVNSLGNSIEASALVEKRLTRCSARKQVAASLCSIGVSVCSAEYNYASCHSKDCARLHTSRKLYAYFHSQEKRMPKN